MHLLSDITLEMFVWSMNPLIYSRRNSPSLATSTMSTNHPVGQEKTDRHIRRRTSYTTSQKDTIKVPSPPTHTVYHKTTPNGADLEWKQHHNHPDQGVERSGVRVNNWGQVSYLVRWWAGVCTWCQSDSSKVALSLALVRRKQRAGWTLGSTTTH